MRFAGFSGSVLKVIAVLSMTVDHIALHLMDEGDWRYAAMRMVGRIAFPIFAFLVAEGYHYTRDRLRYVSCLLFFALLSEIPWVLLHGLGSHNVLFTLSLGVTGLWAIGHAGREPLLYAVPVVLGLFAVLFNADYGISGYALVLAFGLFRCRPYVYAPVGLLLLINEGLAGELLAFLSVLMYNGRRGFIVSRCAKYLFYAYYPCHLMVLWLIGHCLSS